MMDECVNAIGPPRWRASKASEPSDRRRPHNPRYDDLYRHDINTYLKHKNIDLIDVRIRLRKSFEEGALRRNRRAIGDWIDVNRTAMGKTQEEVAQMAYVDVSAVTKWINGDSNITQKNLTKLKCYFAVTGIPLAELDPRDLALEGYREAVTSARSILTGQRAGPIAGEDLLCLFYLYSEPDWGRLRSGRAGDCQFRSLAHSLLERASSPIAATTKHALCRVAEGAAHACAKDLRCLNLAEVRHINTIIREWGTAWLICVECLPEEGAL
jgi:transcriptional regulator with XRE-family HTH domain